MNILASIEHFVQLYFGDFFSSIEAFYLKDILILIQGILELGHHSISSIARDPLNKVAHTTLTRFFNGNPNFWKNLEKLIQKVILSTSSEKMILVVVDTQLARRSKKIPSTTPTYDHNQKRYCQVQVLLTVGRVSDGFFPLEMMFSNSNGGPTKIERLIDWLKENEIRDAVLLGDSWYTNSHVVESYFKTAKQHFSLGKAALSTEDGHKHWTILVILAYLIFNDLHRFILEKTKSETKRYKVFETIQRAISMLRSLLLEQVKIDFHLLDSCFRSFSLLPFY